MSILSIAARGAALVGKSACITAGVWVGTLAVGKALEVVARVQAGRDEDKPLGSAIKEAFGKTADAVKEAAADTAAAVRKAADQHKAEQAKQDKPKEEPAQDDKPKAEVVIDQEAIDRRITPWTALPWDLALVYPMALSYVKTLMTIATNNGFTGDEAALIRLLEDMYAAGGEGEQTTATVQTLNNWAKSLQAEYIAEHVVGLFGEAAVRRAADLGYDISAANLKHHLWLFVYGIVSKNPGQDFSLEVIHNWVNENAFKAKQAAEEKAAQESKAAEAAAAIQPVAVPKPEDDDAAAPLKPNEPVIPTVPVQEPATASTDAAPAAEVSPSKIEQAVNNLKPGVTDADRKAAAAAIDNATRAAADKADARQRRVNDGNAKPGKK